MAENEKYKSDIEIAREAKLQNILEIAEKRLNIPEKFLEPYGSIGGSLSSGSIGSMLRVYVARGSIKAISSPSGPTEYQIASRVVNSSTPLGKYV